MSSLTLDVVTPERVNVALPVAGVGSRAMAWLIDVGLLFAVWVVGYFIFTLAAQDPLALVLGLSQTLKIAGTVGLFATLFVYWTALEVFWDGQTVGKRLMGVRVVLLDGSPVTPTQSAIRNLMRLVDFLPFCYPVGLLTILVDPRHRRLGDLVAGTLLIRDERIDLSRYETRGGAAGGPRLSVADAELVSGFVARFDSLAPTARRSLGVALATRLGVDASGGEDDVHRRLQALVGGERSSALSTFVTERKDGWFELEALLTRLRARRLQYAEITRVDRLYRQASADLARAGRLFAGTDVQRFLNQLCGRAYAGIYRARGSRLGGLKHFFAAEFPRAVQATLPYTLGAAGLIGLGVVLGATTVALAPQGAEMLIDPELRELIERRELWTDTALDFHTPSEMAALIFTNNLKVSFGAFAFGITAGLGTVLLALYNGIHLGALLAACAQHELLGGILTFMAAHAPVELSIISLTAGAGLVIGHALIEPGERSRASWLKERAQLAVRLVLGCAPFLLAIGIVEGFVSPGSFFPWPLKVVMGALSFAAFWRYVLGTENWTMRRRFFSPNPRP